MVDLVRVKSNVAKMVSKGASDTEIEKYVSMEGSNAEEIRGVDLGKISVEGKKSILQNIKEHPFKAILEPLPKTLGGRAPGEVLKAYEQKKLDKAALEGKTNWFDEYGRSAVTGMLGDVADMATSPATYVPIPIGKIPLAGTTVGEVAKTIPVGKGFVEGVKELGRYEQTLKKIMPFSASGVEAKKTISLVPKVLERGIKKYKTAREGSKFEGIRQDLEPLARVENLKQRAIDEYGVPLAQEKEALKQSLGQISTKEEKVLASTKTQIEQSKLKLKSDIDNLSSKMKEETALQEKNIDLTSQRSAVEGKRRFPQLARENSNSYGDKLDSVIDIAEKEGTLPTKEILQDIFNKTDDEVAKAFIDTGAPLAKYNALKEKYLGGFSSDTNPEAQALSKAMGFKKGQLKNAGIDWSKVDMSKSGVKLPTGQPINLKELLQDIKSVRKSISAKGQGAERAFTDEDLVSIIFQKNVGEYMAERYPEFAKLQKAYGPLIEQMKAGRKIFKPGAPYDLGTAPKVLTSPDIVEQKLIQELEKGTKGFSKGLGEISQPIKKAQQKLAGTQKGYEIAKQKIENLGAQDRKELDDLLKMREEAYALAKEKVSARSLQRQKEINDSLNKRLADLETGKFRGKETISKYISRKKVTDREKKVLTGGGLITVFDYLIRRTIAKAVLR